MTLDQVMKAVSSGQTVHWANEGYVVRCDALERWLVVCTWNDYTTGLCESDLKSCFIGEIA